MSNQDGKGIDLDVIERDVLARIRTTLNDRPVSWLAATTGIPNVTLQRHLRAPGDLKLKQLIAISIALEVDFGWLAYGDCPTCGGVK